MAADMPIQTEEPEPQPLPPDPKKARVSFEQVAEEKSARGWYGKFFTLFRLYFSLFSSSSFSD